jgi:NAD-dependent SIR2 family protein deacetylase
MKPIAIEKNQTKSNIEINTVRRLIHESDALLITAGAGMSADSGLPTFRGDQGFWRSFPAFESTSTGFTDIANPDHFRHDPYMAWAFYGYRYDMYQEIEPHSGYSLLLSTCESKRKGYFVFTSNVDGHFPKAGFSENRIVECHGSINRFQCLNQECDHVWQNDQVEFVVDDTCMDLLSDIPTCPLCGEHARPNILMFDDHSWNRSHYQSQSKRFTDWLAQIKASNSKLVVIEIGAGQAIPTVRIIGESMAKDLESVFIRINQDEQDSISPSYSLNKGGLEAIELLFENNTSIDNRAGILR